VRDVPPFKELTDSEFDAAVKKLVQFQKSNTIPMKELFDPDHNQQERLHWVNGRTGPVKVANAMDIFCGREFRKNFSMEMMHQASERAVGARDSSFWLGFNAVVFVICMCPSI
jgi:hypothetical protein